MPQNVLYKFFHLELGPVQSGALRIDWTWILCQLKQLNHYTHFPGIYKYPSVVAEDLHSKLSSLLLPLSKSISHYSFIFRSLVSETNMGVTTLSKMHNPNCSINNVQGFDSSIPTISSQRLPPRASRASSSLKEMDELEASSRLTLLKVLIVLNQWCAYSYSSSLLNPIVVILRESTILNFVKGEFITK